MAKKSKEQTRAKFTETQLQELRELGGKGYTADGLVLHINMTYPGMHITASQFYGVASRHNIPYRRVKHKNSEPAIEEPQMTQNIVANEKKQRMTYTDEMLNYLRSFRHSGLSRMAITKAFNTKFPDAKVSVKQISDKIYHMQVDLEKPQSYTKVDQISIDELPKEPKVKYSEKLNILIEQPSFSKFKVSCKVKQNMFFATKWEKTYMAHCTNDALRAANADLSALLEQNTNIYITKRIVEKM